MKILLAVLLIFTFATSLFAGGLLEQVVEMPILKELLGQAKVIEANDLGNIYEVIVSVPGHGKQILYVTRDGEYLLMGGNLVNREKINVTKARREQLDKVEIDRLPIQDAIVITKGNPVKKLFMFTDVDCPFCKQSYNWLKTQPDLALYVFLLPLSMHPMAHDKSVKILCRENRAEALDLNMSGKEDAGGKCETGETILNKHKATAEGLGISGAPLFITESGTRITGFDQASLSEYLKK